MPENKKSLLEQGQKLTKRSVTITVKENKKGKVAFERKFKNGSISIEAEVEKNQRPKIEGRAKFEWE